MTEPRSPKSSTDGDRKRRLPRPYKGDDVEGQRIACRHTALIPVKVVEHDDHIDIVLAKCGNCNLWIEVPGLGGGR